MHSSLTSLNKGFAAPLLVMVLVVVGILAVGLFVLIPQQKKEAKKLAEQQTVNLKELQSLYKKILETAKQPNLSGDSNELLQVQPKEFFARTAPKSNDMQVLGIEDNPTIKKSRKLIELYRNALDSINKLSETNKELKKRTSIPVLSSLLPTGLSDLTKKTDEFANNSKTTINYLEKSEQAGIKGYTTITEIGIQLQAINPNDPAAVQKLEDKVNEFGTIEQDLEQTLHDSSNALKAYHEMQVKMIKDFKESFFALVNAIKYKDANALARAVKDIVTSSSAAVSTSLLQYETLWQNDPALSGTDSLKNEWEELSKKM